MALSRVFPTIAQDLSRAFALLDEPFFGTAARRLPTLGAFPSGTFRPLVDVSENDKAYVVEAEVPGMKRDELNVEFVDDGTLVLKGRVERGKQDGDIKTIEGSSTDSSTDSTDVSTKSSGDVVASEPTYWSSERVLGAFQRSISFPTRVDPNNVKASYADGILHITVPKVEPRRAKINID